MTRRRNQKRGDVAAISVVICSRNPNTTNMRRVLSSLQEQKLGRGFWELLLVDNASEKPLSDEWDLSWHPAARHVREERVGLSHARVRGIAEATGELIVFLDDDTPMADQYLSAARALWSRHPELGAFGAGSIQPEFEITPPGELIPRLRLLGVRTVPVAASSDQPRDIYCMPHGAGLCVTAGVAAAYRQLIADLGVIEIVGRHGNRLFAGDDDLFSWAAASEGMRFGVFPELGVLHLIPADRLSHDYFVRLCHDHAFSHAVLRFLLTGDKPQGLTFVQRLRLIGHRLKNGRFSMQCRRAELEGQESATRLIEGQELRPLRRPWHAQTSDDRRTAVGDLDRA